VEQTVADPAQPQASPLEDALRVAFVEMLFALAVSEVAIHAAELAQVTNTEGNRLPAIMHLALGLLIIATSWVGWRQSASPGMHERIKTVVSWQFIGLLLDVLIVVLYFVLIKQVEVKTKEDTPRLIPASARPESLWLCWIFAVYAFWDLCTDVFPPECLKWEGLGYLRKVWIFVRASFVSVFASIVCGGMSCYVYNRAEGDLTAEKIVALDIALICIVVLFRLLKLCENFLSRWLWVDHLQAFAKKREVLRRHKVAFVFVVAGYIAAMIFVAN
jgi:hypothetical protein